MNSNLFLDQKAAEMYQCSICLDVLRQPVSLNINLDTSHILPKCTHLFCRECILDWFNSRSNCPCCLKPAIKEDIVIEHRIQKKIAQLALK